jgi:non-ribosomal peptide synthetase component F
MAYWKRRLAGAPKLLALPTARPRPPVQSFRGASRSRRVSRELADRVQALGRAQGATPFMTLLAALDVLLHLWTGELDLVVGSPVGNRDRAELEGLIGLFVNLLALRVDLYGDPEFREVVRRVRQSVLEAQAHQDLPFGRLVEELRPERSLSYTPLFQVAYTFHDVRQAAVELPGLTISPMEIETGTTQFDLILNVEDGPDGMTLALDFNVDLFDGVTISRLLTTLEEILKLAAERQEIRIGELRRRAEELGRDQERSDLETARRQSFRTVRRRVVTGGGDEFS